MSKLGNNCEQEAIKWSNTTLKTWKVNTFNKEAIMSIFWNVALELTKKM